ncbi:MAG: Stp1/IreP family PP2C-type Ser/Thr phosphatase [Clostridia bacterium]|nr:Stp1/IreP family PP2C-type Ser/Thr phosphatase [Clostridia bacterium]
MIVQTGSYSHIGKVRSRNEDSLIVGSGYAVVADGMGGHSKGDVASLMAVSVIRKKIEKSKVKDSKKALKEAVEAANIEIFHYAAENNFEGDMGTTVVACLWDDKNVTVANVGDSRCYCISGDKIERVTKDHSLVQQLVDSGKITEEEAQNRTDKNVILRAVGCEKDVSVDIFQRKINSGDIYFLCSDGMSNLVKEDEIIDGIKGSDLQKSLEKLVALANSRGGSDNITVAAVKFTDDTKQEVVL